MRSNAKNLVLVFLAVSTAGLGLQLYNTRQQLAEARKAPTLQVKRTDITTSAAPAPITAPTSAATLADAAADLPLSQPEIGGGPAGPGGPGGRGGGGARFAAQMAELMKDPEFSAAWKLEQEARLDQRYGALFKQLNLPPEKLAALKSLLAERENAAREVWASATAQGLNPRDNRDELRKLTADLQAEVDNNMKATLGESVVSALNAYNSSAPQRSIVNDFSQKLSYTGQPLNDSQSQQLTRILADTGKVSGRTVLITDATISRAQGVLTPAQVTTLKELQSVQQAQQVVQDKIRTAREQAQSSRNGGDGGTTRRQ